MSDETPEHGRDDLRLDMLMRNNVLWHVIYDRYRSMAAFCRESKKRGFKIGYGDLSKLLCFRDSPFKAPAFIEYRDVCFAIEAALLTPVDILFPEQLYKKFLKSKEGSRRTLEFSSMSALPASVHREILSLPDKTELTSEARVIGDELKSNLENILDILTERERRIICLRYGIGNKNGESLTLEEVGRIIKRNKERVRQIQKKAISKMQKHLVDEDLLPESKTFVPQTLGPLFC